MSEGTQLGAGGRGGRPEGQAWLRSPRRGARSGSQPGPQPRPSRASTPGAASCLRRVGQARALQVHTPVSGIVISRCWVNRAYLTARGWEGVCVISRTVSNSLDLTQWSAEFSLSSPSLHPPRFPQFGSGVACWLRAFRFTFCSAVGSWDISNFQLREVANACVWVT